MRYAKFQDDYLNEIYSTIDNQESDLDFIKDLTIIKSHRSKCLCYWLRQTLALLIIILISLVQLADKMLSGEETLVQIIFTILLAIWTAFYLFFTLRVPISRHIRLMLEF